MHLVQFLSPLGIRRVGLVRETGERLRLLNGVSLVYHLAYHAVLKRQPLRDLVAERLSRDEVDYQSVIAEKRLLPPLDHPEPARFHITGTGLTHLGSADTRDAMHQDLSAKTDQPLTDSKRMFLMGLEGGKPADGGPGVQPEWFYKGNGSTVVSPEQDLLIPPYAMDGGEEPEIVGIYIIAPDGCPWRVGFALGNEFSDHGMEKLNYLYLAHSKLRSCSFGPELKTGPLPSHLEGASRIVRNGQTVWGRPFLTGEDHMSHRIANLEHHHFKYPFFRRPGDLHAHFFGTSTISFADGFQVQDNDRFEIQVPEFGRPLRNQCRYVSDNHDFTIHSL